MDTFEELSSEDLKMTALQFIGQNLSGPLKELDSFIISKNPTLQGKTLDPHKIINSIPGSMQSPVATNVVNAGLNVQQHPVQQQYITPHVVVEPFQKDDNQLEFDFEKKARYSDILDALVDIKTKLSRIEDRLGNKD